MLDNPEQVVNRLLSIEISKDKMQASLLIHEPLAEELPTISPRKLIGILENAGIKFGLKHDVIKMIYDGKRWEETFVVADGKYPINGEDARLEFYFQTEKSLKPKITEDGHVDYKEICIVSSIEKDSVLLKKFNATNGFMGKNVEGADIPTIPGKDIPLKAGKGTYWDTNDKSLLRASTDGIVLFNPTLNSIEIQQHFVIDGSVDYSTGNINLKCSVEVKENVNTGFAITTPYDIMVKGVVEHALIACGGNFTVQTGIIGDDKQIIKVGGDIHAGYINEQHIVCGGSVNVTTEIRNANIECGNEVNLTGTGGVILGGRIIASNKVNAAFIGNVYSVPTEIIVGVNARFRKDLFNKRNERKAIENQISDIQKKITLIAQNSPETLLNSRLGAIKKQWTDCCESFEKVKAEVEALEKAYYNTNDPVVVVTKTVYPGTIIRIREFTYEVKEEQSHVKFVLGEEEIICKPNL